MSEWMTDKGHHQAWQLHLQHDASNCKADADQDSNGHAPVPPAYAKEAQVLSVSHCQVFLLSFCLLSMSGTLSSACCFIEDLQSCSASQPSRDLRPCMSQCMFATTSGHRKLKVCLKYVLGATVEDRRYSGLLLPAGKPKDGSHAGSRLKALFVLYA